MDVKPIHVIANSIVAYKPENGSHYTLAGQLLLTDYNVRIAYRDYVRSIHKLQDNELNNEDRSLGVSMEALTEAKFFFEAIYWFMLAIEKVAKQTSSDPMVKIFKKIFEKYEYLKLPRVNISKDNFGKLIKAESTGDQETIEALTGNSKLMFQFSVDLSGYIKFQQEYYDPHKYFRDYLSLIKEMKKELEALSKSQQSK